MEAVTEELVQRASSSSGKIGNLKEIIEWIGKEWIDMFLSSLFELSEDEKEDWFEKLRAWDTLFSDDESHLACARYAARNMWSNPKLQFILNGGHNETASQRLAGICFFPLYSFFFFLFIHSFFSEGISFDELKGEIQQLVGFKEPMNLISIRITWLEREKKIDQAMNLSLALGLFENAARFQIKLNDIEGARKTTNQIRQSSGLFAVAQVAKPMDVSFAFDLVLKAIVQAYLEALDASKSTLANKDQDMVLWAVGLAEAEEKAELLLHHLASEIKNKEFLMSIFSLLNNKGKSLLALDLGGKILAPYSLEELQDIFKTLRESSQYIRNAWESHEISLPEERKGAFLQHRSTILKFLPFCKANKTLPNQMYRIIISSVADISSDDSSVQAQKLANANDQVSQLIDSMVQKVEEVGAFQLLLSSLANDQKFDDVKRVGSHLLNMAKNHQELERKFQDKRIRDKFEFDEQKQKEMQEKGLPAANSMTLFIEPVRDHPYYGYDRVSKEVYKTLVDSGMRDLRSFIRIESSFAPNGDMEVDAKETDIEKKLREEGYKRALSVLEDLGSRVFEFLLSVESILSLAILLFDDCLRISLSMLRGCFELIQKARATAKGLEDVEERLAILESEIQALADEKQKPSAGQMQSRRDLRLEAALHAIVPNEFKQSVSHYDSLNFRVGRTLLSQAIVGFVDVNKTERVPADEVKQLLDLVLENVLSPQSLLDIASAALTSEPIHLIYLVNQTIPRLQALQSKWKERAILETERLLLVEEQNEFQSKFKKDLDEPQLKRLGEVQVRLSEIASDESSSAISGSGIHAHFFLKLQYRLVRLKIQSVLQKRNEVILTIEKTDIDRTEEQEERLKSELAGLQEQLKSVFEGCISQLKLSSQFGDLLNYFSKSSDASLSRYPEFAETDLCLLLVLLEHALEFDSELEKVREIELKKIDARTIDDEAQQLWEECSNRQMLPTEQRDKHRSLKLQIRAFAQDYSGGEAPTLQNVFSMRKQMFQRITSLITKLSSSLCDRYRAEYKTLEEYLVQAATEATPALCARQRSKLGELQKLASCFGVLLSRVVDLVESKASGPGTIRSILQAIAVNLPDCCEGESQECSSALLIRLFSHMMTVLKTLDEERQAKLPVFEAVAKFEREHAESLQLRKPFPKESLAKLKEHQRQINIWNTELSSKRLEADAIWEYLIDTATVVCENILSRRKKLDSAASHWKNQIAQGEKDDDQMSDGDGKNVILLNFYLQRSKEEEDRSKKVGSYWDALGAQLFEAIASPYHSVRLMGVIQDDPDLTIQFAQNTFANLTEARNTFEERKPVSAEYTLLTTEKTELLTANKALRSAEADRLDELTHLVFEWNHQPSYMRMTPNAILSLNRTSSELLLKSIFSKISKLNTAVDELQALAQSEPSETTHIAVEYKILSESERAKLLQSSSKELEETIGVLKNQLTACFPFMTEPSHLINTARMCARAGQLESALLVCEHAFETVSKLESKREDIASTFRRHFIQELEKFFMNEYRLAADKSMETMDLSGLLSEDLSQYQGPPVQSFVAPAVIPRLSVNFASFVSQQGGQPRHLQSFYSFLGTVSMNRELLPGTLHLQISRYATANVADANYPVDLGAPYVHSDFVASLKDVAVIMIGSIIEQRNRLRNEVEEKRKFEQKVDEKKFKKQMATFNKQILETFERVSESIDDVSQLNDLVRQIINLDNQDADARLRSDEFDLSLSVCRTFLAKVSEEVKELREYEPKVLSYIKLLSEEEVLVSQRKELPPAQLEELRSLRSTFAEMFTFPACHRMPLQHYNALAFDLAHELVLHLLNFKREKENELEAMVRQPRLIRGRSMSEDEIKQEFTDNSLLQEKLKLQVTKLVLEFVNDPTQLSLLAKELHQEKEMEKAIEVAGKAQDILKLRLADRLRYEALMKQLVDRSRLPQGTGGGVSEEIQEIIDELETFRYQLTDPIQLLRQSILSLADIMIEAARAEEREDVLQAQSILVFKMEMSVQKFEEVHTLVGDEKWESEIRDDLLSYVHAYDPTLPGSPITLVAKIELLVREKWWKEALEHRPEPTAADASSSVEVLKLLWFAVESNSPDDLGELVETIKAFTIKEFQKFNLTAMDALLDLMQEGFPQEIFDLYSKGSEIMMTNSSSKKYKIYVDYLVAMKGRMLAVGLVDEWNDFVKKVRKKEIRKKNLINMMDVHDL